jgi:hypothetical protein
LLDRACDDRRAEAEAAQRCPDLGDDVGRVGRVASALEAQRVRGLAGDTQVAVMDRGVVMGTEAGEVARPMVAAARAPLNVVQLQPRVERQPGTAQRC